MDKKHYCHKAMCECCERASLGICIAGSLGSTLSSGAFVLWAIFGLIIGMVGSLSFASLRGTYEYHEAMAQREEDSK